MTAELSSIDVFGSNKKFTLAGSSRGFLLWQLSTAIQVTHLYHLYQVRWTSPSSRCIDGEELVHRVFNIIIVELTITTCCCRGQNPSYIIRHPSNHLMTITGPQRTSSIGVRFFHCCAYIKTPPNLHISKKSGCVDTYTYIYIY